MYRSEKLRFNNKTSVTKTNETNYTIVKCNSIFSRFFYHDLWVLDCDTFERSLFSLLNITLVTSYKILLLGFSVPLI